MNPLLLIGSSHLAFRVGKKLHARNVPFVQIPSERFVEHTLEVSDLEHAKEVLAAHHVSGARAVCILGDADAAALISTVSDDLKNLEIGLNARSLRNDIRLILRIFDREIADEVKERFHIHFAYSTSSLAAQHLVGALTEPRA